MELKIVNREATKLPYALGIDEAKLSEIALRCTKHYEAYFKSLAKNVRELITIMGGEPKTRAEMEEIIMSYNPPGTDKRAINLVFNIVGEAENLEEVVFLVASHKAVLDGMHEAFIQHITQELADKILMGRNKVKSN